MIDLLAPPFLFFYAGIICPFISVERFRGLLLLVIPIISFAVIWALPEGISRYLQGLGFYADLHEGLTDFRLSLV